MRQFFNSHIEPGTKGNKELQWARINMLADVDKLLTKPELEDILEDLAIYVGDSYPKLRFLVEDIRLSLEQFKHNLETSESPMKTIDKF